MGLYVGAATVGVFAIWYTHTEFMGIDLSQDGHTPVTYDQLTHWQVVGPLNISKFFFFF